MIAPIGHGSHAHQRHSSVHGRTGGPVTHHERVHAQRAAAHPTRALVSPSSIVDVYWKPCYRDDPLTADCANSSLGVDCVSDLRLMYVLCACVRACGWVWVWVYVLIC